MHAWVTSLRVSQRIRQQILFGYVDRAANLNLFRLQTRWTDMLLLRMSTDGSLGRSLEWSVQVQGVRACLVKQNLKANNPFKPRAETLHLRPPLETPCRRDLVLYLSYNYLLGAFWDAV